MIITAPTFDDFERSLRIKKAAIQWFVDDVVPWTNDSLLLIEQEDPVLYILQQNKDYVKDYLYLHCTRFALHTWSRYNKNLLDALPCKDWNRIYYDALVKAIEKVQKNTQDMGNALDDLFRTEQEFFTVLMKFINEGDFTDWGEGDEYGDGIDELAEAGSESEDKSADLAANKFEEGIYESDIEEESLFYEIAKKVRWYSAEVISNIIVKEELCSEEFQLKHVVDPHYEKGLQLDFFSDDEHKEIIENEEHDVMKRMASFLYYVFSASTLPWILMRIQECGDLLVDYFELNEDIASSIQKKYENKMNPTDVVNEYFSITLVTIIKEYATDWIYEAVAWEDENPSNGYLAEMVYDFLWSVVEDKDVQNQWNLLHNILYHLYQLHVTPKVDDFNDDNDLGDDWEGV
jgi:hypothetical protein